MIERFEGADGRRNLITALVKCSITEHNGPIAEKFADVGQLLACNAGDTILSQGSSDNDVYFLLVGQADVLVNNRLVATRGAGDTVGEMAILNPAEPRSATVIARSQMVLLKLSESDFYEILQEHPQLWKAIACVVAERLRQRIIFHSPPNDLPVLFLGCSVEGLSIAQEIQLSLKHDKFVVKVWTDGLFSPSGIALDDLLKAVHQADFAAFVFSPDDTTISRETEFDAPRDNVIFELGLFMGLLERSRTFIIKEGRTDIKIPTDLLGITPLTYVYGQGNEIESAIAPVCTELRKVMNNLGTR